MTLYMRERVAAEKGREEGIIGMIITLKELNISDDIILKKLH